MSTKNKNITKSIKEYEKSQRQAAQKFVEVVETVDFDQWWADRSAALKQPAHIKEILKADAMARGLTGKQQKEKWDWAARQFGLSI